MPPSTDEGKFKTFFLIALLSTAVFFIAAEVATRYFCPDLKFNPQILVISEEFHHSYAPNAEWYTQNPPEDGGGKILFHTNDLSIRGGAIENRSNANRILIIGDSFIQADEIPFEFTLGKQIEKILSSKNLEVIQHGVTSWAPLLELNWYNKIGRRFKPRVVILQLCVNDFAQSYGKSDYNYAKVAEWDSEGLPKRFKVHRSRLAPVKIFLLRHSKFLLFVANLRAKYLNPLIDLDEDRKETRVVSQKDIEDLLEKGKDFFKSESEKVFVIPKRAEFFTIYAGPKYWSNKIKANIEQSMSYVEKLNKLVTSDGAVLVVFDAPLGFVVGPLENGISKQINYRFEKDVVWPYGLGGYFKDRFEKMGVKYIDMQNELAKISDGSLYNKIDGHWSKIGHRKVAEILAREIANLF